MKWQALPGPAKFINDSLQQIRDGSCVVVATPSRVPSGFEDTFIDLLRHDRCRLQQVAVNSRQDPLRLLTEDLYLEPENWVRWNVEKFYERLESGEVIAVGGVDDSNWDAWRQFLRDFEVTSRRRQSDERAVLLVFVRGVPRRSLQIEGAALGVRFWSGIVTELDALLYADQQLRGKRAPARYHKLVVRQIAALALWDFDLADFLANRPERELFATQDVLSAARAQRAVTGPPNWENGGLDFFDGAERLHSFVLIEQGDEANELGRRVWTAQAAELFPLIEVRRRALAKDLQRHVVCPLWIDSDRKVDSLDELEIGSLAHVARTKRVPAALLKRAEWLANCRNTLAHLSVLACDDALDSRLYE